MKLSPKQMQVYIRMDYKWKSAYKLQARLDTLNALVRKGYAESKRLVGADFFPQNRIMFRKSDKPIS